MEKDESIGTEVACKGCAAFTRAGNRMGEHGFGYCQPASAPETEPQVRNATYKAADFPRACALFVPRIQKGGRV